MTTSTPYVRIYSLRDGRLRQAAGRGHIFIVHGKIVAGCIGENLMPWVAARYRVQKLNIVVNFVYARSILGRAWG